MAQEPACAGTVLGEPLNHLFSLYLLLRLESEWGKRQTQPQLWHWLS